MSRRDLEDEFFSNDVLAFRRKRRENSPLNLITIIDMMTTIIFFLVLTTSFTAYTKHTLPPSGISTQAGANKIPPLQPIFMIGERPEGLVLDLSWKGAAPGSSRQVIAKQRRSNIEAEQSKFENEFQILVRTKTEEMVASFNKSYPLEKTLQMGMTSNTRYQNLISVMDGSKNLMPDIVLIDYLNVDAQL